MSRHNFEKGDIVSIKLDDSQGEYVILDFLDHGATIVGTVVDDDEIHIFTKWWKLTLISKHNEKHGGSGDEDEPLY